MTAVYTDSCIPYLEQEQSLLCNKQSDAHSRRRERNVTKRTSNGQNSKRKCPSKLSLKFLWRTKIGTVRSVTWFVTQIYLTLYFNVMCITSQANSLDSAMYRYLSDQLLRLGSQIAHLLWFYFVKFGRTLYIHGFIRIRYSLQFLWNCNRFLSYTNRPEWFSRCSPVNNLIKFRPAEKRQFNARGVWWKSKSNWKVTQRAQQLIYCQNLD